MIQNRISETQPVFEPLVNETRFQMAALLNTNVPDVPSAHATQFKPLVDEVLTRLQDCRIAYGPLVDEAIAFGAVQCNDLVEFWHRCAIKEVLKAEDAVATATHYIRDAHNALRHTPVRPEKWDEDARQFVANSAATMTNMECSVVFSHEFCRTESLGNARVLYQVFNNAEVKLIQLRDWTREHGIEVALVAAASGKQIALLPFGEAHRYLELAWTHLQAAKRLAATAEGEAGCYKLEPRC